MEKRTARLFCGFGTFILLLYTVEVWSAPAVNSIINVMQNDNSICKTPNFLFLSNYTKSCLNQTYPTEDTELIQENIDTFLCLGVYDASYKICNYGNQWQVLFSNASAFDANVEKFSISTGKGTTVEFCKLFTEITPMYNKTKLFVSLLTKKLNDPFDCQFVCFNTQKELNPLCAILSWINIVDTHISKAVAIDDTKKEVITGDTKSQESSHAQPITDPNSNKPDKKPTLKHKSEEKNPDTNPLPLFTVNKINSEKVSADKLIKSTDVEKQEAINDRSQMPSTLDSDTKHLKEEDRVVLPVPPASDPKAPTPIGDKAVKTSKENTDIVKDVPDDIGRVESSEPKEKLKVTSSDIKTSTLSENTQDHEGTNDENESSCNDNGQFLPGADNILKPSFDGGELTHNIPESSEQRDSPHYHNPRLDEESHFFTYFTVMSLVFIVAYIGYHNKQKVLAIVLEGRRSRNSRSRRRPSTASYRKLDCTLEEAVTSQCNANVTHVIY